ncbi:MAG: ribosome biogenesis GTP-binding protein YihA/YsxC [Bacteroidales bacterium]|nr:ribosome biogenesis GTP-binding protein YihA/YsxC [Bacteroidales bacterium]MCF8456160.1 ribosome biogenesis GTP-binding protein YihA/YsxC [Bacteroidales bacterium]
MIIKTAEFLMSNSLVAKCPQRDIPEYAFIGRSNVGKSSLINMLTNHSKLAKTSGTPGKTQLINHFLINDAWFLVDLPGYGYAKVSKKLRAGFSQIITNYLKKREQLFCLFVLLDSRLEPQKADLEFMDFLGNNGIPFVMVFTKADKLKPTELERNLANYKTIMLESWDDLPEIFITSATSTMGRDEVLGFISKTNKEFDLSSSEV